MYNDKINYKLLNILILMLLIYITINNIGTWYNIISKVFKCLIPFVVSFILAYILNPIVRFIKSKIRNKTLSIIIVLLCFSLFLILLISYTLPLFYKELIVFYKDIGNIFDNIANKYNIDLIIVKEYCITYLKKIIVDIGFILKNNILNIILKTTSVIGKIIITFVVFIYFLFSMDKIKYLLRKILKKRSFGTYNYLKIIDKELFNYLKGLSLSLIIQFFEYSIIYFIIGHKNWLLLGILASITTIIPYFGSLFTTILALVTASLVSSKLLFLTLIVSLILPQIDSYIISPKIYGKTNNINPFITIIIISLSGSLFGFLGISLAIPIYVIVNASYKYFKKDLNKVIIKFRSII